MNVNYAKVRRILGALSGRCYLYIAAVPVFLLSWLVLVRAAPGFEGIESDIGRAAVDWFVFKGVGVLVAVQVWRGYLMLSDELVQLRQHGYFDDEGPVTGFAPAAPSK